MPRGRGRARGLPEWVQDLGEQIGAELGAMIAESVQRTLESSLDAKAIAQRLGAGLAGTRRGHRASGARGACSEPGCHNPVLAKGLCRSHYYRARYRAQKAGALSSRRGRKPRNGAPESPST